MGWNPFPKLRASEQKKESKMENSRQFKWSLPELRYPDPNPYSYTVDHPSIVYREVEHIRPPKYVSPVPYYGIERYPEGYTNEYDDYYIENYFGSEGGDHRHYTYDNIGSFDPDHNHFDLNSNVREMRIQPERDAFFVPVVQGPRFEADYSDPFPFDPLAELKKATYIDNVTNAEYYLYNN
jgi:hypothetical protein